jgi:hypothetical protein
LDGINHPKWYVIYDYLYIIGFNTLPLVIHKRFSPGMAQLLVAGQEDP